MQHEEIFQRWTNQTPDLEKISLLGWANALKAEGICTGKNIGLSVAQRFSHLQEEGLIDHPLVVARNSEFLKEPTPWITPFGSQNPEVFVILQPENLECNAPNIKGEKFHVNDLVKFCFALERKFPKAHYMLTILPYFKISRHANVIVGSDHSITIEACDRHASVSRGYDLAFNAHSPAFQEKFIRVLPPDPQNIEFTRLIMAALPKRETPEGWGDEIRPGYYEVSLGSHPGTGKRKIFFNDFREFQNFK